MKRFLLLLLLALPAFAQKYLYWDEVRVKATLEDDGTLRVREEQTYVFNGDWNGGERTFELGKGQGLSFQQLSRRDASGHLVPMTQGSLDVIDGYEVSDNRVRWRSRLPSDPAFVNERLTYVLDYAITGVLEKRGDRYNIDHNFAFPDRAGDIRRFILDFDLGRSWAAPDVALDRELGPIAPGDGVRINVDLNYVGAGAPNATVSTMPLRVVLAGLVLIAPVLLWSRFVRREEQLGRLAPVQATGVNPDWIADNLLPIPAEVAGAAWDEDVGAHEVSALLARWAGEGKITATARSGSELRMKLNVPRETFEGYERELVDKMFFAGDETNTSAIKAHYKDKGFSPSNIIGRPVQEKAGALAQLKEPAPPVSKLPSLALFVIAAILIAASLMRQEDGPLIALSVGVFLIWMLGILFAIQWRGRIDYGLTQSLSFRICLGLIVIGVVVALLRDWPQWPGHAGLVAAALLAANNIFNVAKSKRGPSAIAFRKRLAAVRQYFMDELKKPAPAIDDSWFPYVIAFGLDQQASAWSTDVARRSPSSTYIGSTSSSTSSGSSSTPQWTGGGGSFGGAGASGSWATAASGIAAGVASASSSSSSGGGGGGGGGGRSGGGGGGGW
jgi:uncharacterized membrane protein YgcG